jgi:hypothetical protein
MRVPRPLIDMLQKRRNGVLLALDFAFDLEPAAGWGREEEHVRTDRQTA